MLLGIDAGDIFTDFVYFDGLNITSHKTLSTTDVQEKAILRGIEEMKIQLEGLKDSSWFDCCYKCRAGRERRNQLSVLLTAA